MSEHNERNYCAWCGRFINLDYVEKNIDGNRVRVHPEHVKYFDYYHTPWSYRVTRDRLADESTINNAISYMRKHERVGENVTREDDQNYTPDERRMLVELANEQEE